MRNEEGLAFHLHIKEGDVGRYVLLPGDPARCEKIAKYFDNPHFVAQNREYVTWSGTPAGREGIGGFHWHRLPVCGDCGGRIDRVGADTLVRVGSSGSMQPNVHMGDVVVVTASIRDEGTTSHYLPLEYPAVADMDVVNALRAGALKLGLSHHCGVSQSKDSFYGEVERTRMPMAGHLEERWNAWVAGGAMCSEMESSALFILSSIYRKRAGGVMLVINESDLAETAEEDAAKHMREFDADSVIKTAIEGFKILIEQDRRSKTH